MSDARSNKRLASSVSSFRLCRFVSSSISSSLSTSEFSEFSSPSSNPKSLKNWRAADATEAQLLATLDAAVASAALPEGKS